MVRQDDPVEAWTQHGYSEEEARALIAWLDAEKRRLMKRPRQTVGSSAETRNVPRSTQEIVRKKANRLRRSRPHNLPKAMLVAKYKEVPLLEGLLPSRGKIWKPILKRPIVASPPELDLANFSMVHDPVGTMEKFGEIIRIESGFTRARLNFLDEECLDIGPFLLLQAVRRHLTPVYSGGRMTVETQRVIDAVGLRVPLQMAPFHGVTDHDGIWPFHLRQRRPANTSQSARRQLEPQNKEAVGDQFIAKVNEWLSVVTDQKLTRDGRRLVKKMVGEVLDNAERHSQISSDDGDWALTGYLVRRKVAEGSVFRIHIGMMSIGSTIAESISSGPPAMLARMDDYVRRHAGRVHSTEALQTVFALQDGVTRDHAAASSGRGGTGFQDIFTFFADLGDPHPSPQPAQLVIVSGGTCIKISGSYRCGIPKAGMLNSERELWFNSNNTPLEPPDGGHVRALNNRLSGTLISMVIPLDTDYLESTIDG